MRSLLEVCRICSLAQVPDRLTITRQVQCIVLVLVRAYAQYIVSISRYLDRQRISSFVFAQCLRVHRQFRVIAVHPYLCATGCYTALHKVQANRIAVCLLVLGYLYEQVISKSLGLGLAATDKLSEGKDCLTVLDFIGQANKKYSFESKFAALLSNTSRSVVREIKDGFTALPKGCYIQLERKAVLRPCRRVP